jgi:hypothetical protein
VPLALRIFAKGAVFEFSFHRIHPIELKFTIDGRPEFVVWLRVLSRTNPPPSKTPNSFRFRTSANPRILHHFGANKSFRICTYRHPYCNSFRICTYKNTGGGGGSVPRCLPVRQAGPCQPRPCRDGKSIVFRYLPPLFYPEPRRSPPFSTPLFCFQQLRASFPKASGVGVSPHIRATLSDSVSLWQILLFHTLADSLSFPKKSSPLQSSKSKLFVQNTRGGVPLHSAPRFAPAVRSGYDRGRRAARTEAL